LTTVTFGNNSELASIGESAFRGCSKLNAIEIPASVTSIGSSAFNCCTVLTAIKIPASVTSIGASAFNDCTELTEITIPNSVTSMGNSAFRGCTKLTTVTIGSGITTIEEYTFYGCAVLTAVTIPANITTVGHYAFWNCSSLTDVTIVNCGTTYEGNSFSSTANITQTAHVWVVSQVTAATETTDEQILYTCTECKGQKTETVHTWGTTVYTWGEENKTCTTTHSCTKCTEYETAEASVTNETTLEPTCTAQGQTTYTAVFTETWAANPPTLVLTNIDETGHSTVLQNAKDATCTEAGYTGDLVCTVCNTTVEAGETIPATGHSFGAWETIPATGHSFGAWETVESPTCADDGSERRVCAVCGFTETRGVDAAGHDWETEYTIDKAATCTTDGSQSIHCKNCDVVKDAEVIPATGHSYEAVFTWSEDGTSAVLGLTCAACGDVQTAAATVTSEVKTAATAAENGVTVYTATVTFNGVTYTATKELADIPATGEATEPPAESASPSASPTATATANTAPTTGDGASPFLWALLAAVCAAGLGAVLALGRKEKAER
ncbi:MAG: leucine-rich repeat domain-containing protein, partial [Oscillospiraceae bacterium]|nr:leucine-rich repeat domain-containing protein [Oscillospiraceae bacterium]